MQHAADAGNRTVSSVLSLLLTANLEFFLFETTAHLDCGYVLVLARVWCHDHPQGPQQLCYRSSG